MILIEEMRIFFLCGYIGYYRILNAAIFWKACDQTVESYVISGSIYSRLDFASSIESLLVFVANYTSN